MGSNLLRVTQNKLKIQSEHYGNIMINTTIYIGEGVIPQVERYAHKYAYNKLSTEVFNAMINTISEKSDNPTGNKIAVICNEALWQQVNITLGKYLSDNHVDGTHLWSKAANDYIKVGAAYNTYRFAGKHISLPAAA